MLIRLPHIRLFNSVAIQFTQPGLARLGGYSLGPVLPTCTQLTVVTSLHAQSPREFVTRRLAAGDRNDNGGGDKRVYQLAREGGHRVHCLYRFAAGQRNYRK